jgi:hypothetical protein
VRLHDALAEAEPEAVTAGLLRARAVDAGEGLEEGGPVGLGDPGAVVAHAHHDVVRLARGREDDGRAVGEGVLGGVLEEVAEDRADLLRVDAGRELARGELEEDARRRALERRRRRPEDRGDVVRVEVQRAPGR